jgi:hypothetical protein
MSKYDTLALTCFGKTYYQLDLDEAIIIEDLFAERNE